MKTIDKNKYYAVIKIERVILDSITKQYYKYKHKNICIKCFKNKKYMFTFHGDNGAHVIYINDHTEVDYNCNTEYVTHSTNIDYFKLINKCIPVCPYVHLYIINNECLLIQYPIMSLGNILICIPDELWKKEQAVKKIQQFIKSKRYKHINEDNTEEELCIYI